MPNFRTLYYRNYTCTTCKQIVQTKHYFTSIRVLAETEKDRTLVGTESTAE